MTARNPVQDLTELKDLCYNDKFKIILVKKLEEQYEVIAKLSERLGRLENKIWLKTSRF